MLWINRRLGWRIGYALLYPITAYFVAASPAARVASRDFLRRAAAGPPTLARVTRHIFTYAAVILDRVAILSGQHGHLRTEVEGIDALKAALARGRGCVLLGAHFGSFDVLRGFGRASPVSIRPLMYRAQPNQLSTIIEAIDPSLQAAIIELGHPETMLRARECIARGEIIGLLADRAPRGERMIKAPFLGEIAYFPAGPLILASLLDAPVLLSFGIRTGPRRYSARFIPFADTITLRRETRQEDLSRYAGRYAAILGDMCRSFPCNWFNFYDFWEQRDEA
jgi:predicted LPLAT superfamily acyltransferase